MKHVKMLGLAVVVAAAFMAIVGAGTASATELCSGATACETMYPVGTAIVAKSTKTLVLESTTGTVLDECKKGEVKGNTTTTGGASETVKGAITALTWIECSKPTETTTNGELEIHAITPTGNGTLTGSGSVVKVSTILGVCSYGTGAGTDLGTLEGGKPAKISISAIVKKISGNFACPEEARWTAGYEITSPNPLFVH